MVAIDLSRVLRKQSDLLRLTDPVRSKALLDEVRPMLQRAIELDPDHAPLMRQHYLAIEAMGNLLCEDPENIADVASGLIFFTEHRDLAMQLATRFPEDLRYQRDLGLAMRKIGWARSQLGQWFEAEAALRASLGHFERNAGIAPENIRHGRDIGWACWYLGDLLILQDKHEEGTVVLLRCVSYLVDACVRQPGSADYRGDVRDVVPVVHATLVEIDRQTDADSMLRETQLQLQRLFERNSDNLALAELLDGLRALSAPGR